MEEQLAELATKIAELEASSSVTNTMFAETYYYLTIPLMIMMIPRLMLMVNCSFRNKVAIMAVNAGPVDRMDDDIDGPMRSMLIKYSQRTSAGDNMPARINK